MPTYQYACTSCSNRMRKVYGSVGVVFKGSGFYRNDSRDTKSGAAKTTDSSKSPSSDGSAKTTDSTKSAANGSGSNSSSGSDAKPVTAAAS
jgi:predicted nucleic acid-binding Zn ribbon protein